MCRKIKLKIISFVLLFGVVFYIMNTIIPFFSDDLWLTKDSGNQESLVGKISYLIEFAWDFWNNENGRIVNQVLWKIFCLFGENAFDAFNGVLFVITVFLVVKLSVNKNHLFYPLPYILVLIYELYLIPNSGSLYYWAAGSFNYLFPSALAVCFLLILRWLNGKRQINGFVIGVIGIYSFLAGFTHEIYSLPISFSLFVVILYKRLNINKLLFIPILCFWIGALLVVVSPGTIHRIMGTQTGEDISIFSSFSAKLLQSFKIFHYGRLFYLILFLLLYLLFFRCDKFLIFVKRYAFLLLCMFSSLSIVAIMGVGGRAVCGVEFFSLLIIVNYLSTIEQICKKHDNVYFVILGLMLIHQVYLLSFAAESWNTYKEVVAESDGKGPTPKTIGMKDWTSDNIFVDPFVAHPYKMMREDMWMRKPLYCEVCREDVYSTLKYGDITNGEIGDDYIFMYSDNIIKDIEKEKLYMHLEPITSDFEGGMLFKVWHLLVQRIMPSRYPSEVLVHENDVTNLEIGNKHFLRFESPYAPVPRKIISVYSK